MAIKKILVPIDGSANSLRGLNIAADLAKTSGASITIAHAVYEQSRSEFKQASSVSEERKAEAVKIIEKAKKLLEKNGVKYKSNIVYGNTGYNILKMAHSKSEKFDMIVIGSRGRGSLKEMFFGSTSNYIIHSSKIPVLIVK